MGGRGGFGTAPAKKVVGSPDGVFPSDEWHEIEAVHRIKGGQRGSLYNNYGDEVLEATTDGKGNIKFSYASGGEWISPKTNIKQHVRYTLRAGAINSHTFGIDWSKVQSVSGRTFNIRQAAKEAGLKWDSKTKTWRR